MEKCDNFPLQIGQHALEKKIYIIQLNQREIVHLICNFHKELANLVVIIGRLSLLL